jgi:hypothetical protein
MSDKCTVQDGDERKRHIDICIAARGIWGADTTTAARRERASRTRVETMRTPHALVDAGRSRTGGSIPCND